MSASPMRSLGLDKCFPITKFSATPKAPGVAFVYINFLRVQYAMQESSIRQFSGHIIIFQPDIFLFLISRSVILNGDQICQKYTERSPVVLH